MKMVSVRGAIGGLLFALSLTSCAFPPPKVWYRPHTDAAQLQRDDYECKREAALAQEPPGVRTPSSSIHRGSTVLRQMVSDQTMQNLANDCMRTKGYRQVTQAEQEKLQSPGEPSR